MIFAVNLTVDTKTTDLYDKVAINKYPVIVICNDEQELCEKLSSENTGKWIKENIRTKHLFESAFFHIRGIMGLKNYNVMEFNWKVDSLHKDLY